MGILNDIENGILTFIWKLVFWGSLLLGLILILAYSGVFDNSTTTTSPTAEQIQKTRYYVNDDSIIPVQDKNGNYADITVEYETEANGTIKIGEDGNFIKAGEWDCKDGFCAPPKEALEKYNLK